MFEEMEKLNDLFFKSTEEFIEKMKKELEKKEGEQNEQKKKEDNIRR